ncbi:DUF1127 domain-containing protein [Mesorhizobium helmanticense]|uniref:YjiS-like domain-containing protein n=1 Tax=Mesorhizobium helmanticense TaxID=1776423 RepID=A0A2T4ISC7_9HYPH|nr:DUF1127 domain-containing protein [Mesorhizobium helmanticense]PTE08478.1 hypothetical protein C9427_21125 [Mesorhizobium helmanticense]
MIKTSCEPAFVQKRIASPFLRLALAMLARMARGWRSRRDRRHLEAMPDFMLRDIGISRSDIDYVAAHGDTRRTAPDF